MGRSLSSSAAVLFVSACSLGPVFWWPLRTRNLRRAVQSPDRHSTEENRYQLQTRRYSYHLYLSDPQTSKAVFRWEYEKQLKAPALHCRHHFHLKTTIPLGKNGTDGKLNIEEFHLPTGWVLVEDVFRFLISELAVVPPCGDKWSKVLESSRERFFSDFSVKGPPGK
jgi:hypothetical protein